MNFTDITVGDHLYRVGRLSALTQLHVTRRLAPVIAALGVSVSELAQHGKSMSQDDALFGMLGPVAEVAAKMADDDVNYIINNCLAVVTRAQADGRYAPVMRGTQLMFQDIEMPTMMRLAVEVLKENLLPFFQGLPGVSSTPSASAAGGAAPN